MKNKTTKGNSRFFFFLQFFLSLEYVPVSVVSRITCNSNFVWLHKNQFQFEVLTFKEL